MKKLLKYLLLFIPFLSYSHGGEDHSDEKKATPALLTSYFTSVANSEKYELLLKYEPLKGGEEATLRLYISDFKTNKAIDDAKLEITLAGNTRQKFAVQHLETGIYELQGSFPADKSYSLQVNINTALGPDLMVLENIEVGKELAVADEPEAESFFSSENIFLLLAGAGIGGLLVLLFLGLRNRKIQPKHTLILLMLVSVPVSTTRIVAHGGEDHGDEAKKPQATEAGDTFIVPKESQYLFNILTITAGKEAFTGSTDFLGTVVPAPTGMAVIQSPQTGKIVALRTTVGQHVKKGQVLVVIEQALDAATQVDLLTQRNNAEAEYNAAKAQYDRLKSIADIAAKKDVKEAEARFRSAESNRRLLRQLGSSGAGNSKLINLTSPINGTVGSFNYTIGAVVNAGETLFSVTNLAQVYVEAQIYGKDAASIKAAKEIVATSTTDSAGTTKLRLVSAAQTVNDANQTQRFIFEAVGSTSQFKIGQNITVRVFSGDSVTQLVIPNTAITEINGKQAVFLKDSPESYTVSYIQKGADNGTATAVSGGLKPGDRVVNAGTYQMKTMFLNR